jgi:GNAT superfamily N-acetyltransferase
MGIQIRPANAADEAAARACVQAAFAMYVERIGKPPGPMLLDYAAHIAAGHIWVAETDDRVVGTLVQFETQDGFYIDTVAAHPDAQGTGVGRALLVFAEEEACRRGYDSLYLCTNEKMTENQVFYPRIGYVETARRLEAGYQRVFYRKTLGRGHGAVS